MNIIVPDASVILKWVLVDDEPEQEKALLILKQWLDGNFDILLPPLWAFEVANILGLKIPDRASSTMKNLLEYEFELCSITDTLCHRTFQMMKASGSAFYDTVYHALAVQEKGLLVTADKKYIGKAKEKKSVQLLAEWS